MTDNATEIGKQFGNIIMNMMEKNESGDTFDEISKLPECELLKRLDSVDNIQEVMNGLLNCVMEKTQDWSRTPEEEDGAKKIFGELKEVVVPFLMDKQIKAETPLTELCKELQAKYEAIKFGEFDGTLFTLEELETYQKKHGVDFVKQECITTFDNEADVISVTQKKHVLTIYHRETKETYEYVTTMTSNMKLYKVCLQG